MFYQCFEANCCYCIQDSKIFLWKICPLLTRVHVVLNRKIIFYISIVVKKKCCLNFELCNFLELLHQKANLETNMDPILSSQRLFKRKPWSFVKCAYRLSDLAPSYLCVCVCGVCVCVCVVGVWCVCVCGVCVGVCVVCVCVLDI